MGTSLLAPLRNWNLQRFLPSLWAKKPVDSGFSNPNRDPYDLHRPEQQTTPSSIYNWAVDGFKRIGEAVNFRDKRVAQVLDAILDPNANSNVLNQVEAKFYLGGTTLSPSKNFFALDNVRYQEELIAVTDLSNKTERQLKGFLLIPKPKASLQDCSSLCTILPGIRSGLDHNLDLVQKLLDKGNAVFIANYAGFPDNPMPGYPTKSSLVEDAQAILKHSSKLANGLPLKVIAHSLGSAITTKALTEIFAEEKHNANLNVTDLVLVSAWDSFDALLDSMLENGSKAQDPHLAALVEYAKTSEANKTQVRQASSKMTGSYWHTGETVQALLDLNAHRPQSRQIKQWTMIHGENDKVVNLELARALAQRIKNHWSIKDNFHFIPVKNAEHFQGDSVPAEFL